MILGALSDTHLDHMEKSLEKLLSWELGGCDLVVHAGDHVSRQVVDHLEYVDPRPYYGVAGNMDGGELARRLPRVLSFNIGGLSIGLTHGHGSPAGIIERVRAEFTEAPDVLIFGHTHVPLIERRGKTLMVNPGSAFHPRWNGGGTVALIEIANGAAQARIVEIGK